MLSFFLLPGTHLVAKIWAELAFQNSMAAILDFFNFKHIPSNRKNDNIIFLHLAYIQFYQTTGTKLHKGPY